MEIMLELKSRTQNKQKTQKHTYSRVSTQTAILVPTLQREVKTKNETKITRQTLYELARLYKDAYTEKPGWLRCYFTVDQRRRKKLNCMLRESGLDGNWCGHSCDTSEWSGLLHVFWHDLNGRPKCL